MSTKIKAPARLLLYMNKSIMPHNRKWIAGAILYQKSPHRDEAIVIAHADAKNIPATSSKRQYAAELALEPDHSAPAPGHHHGVEDKFAAQAWSR